MNSFVIGPGLGKIPMLVPMISDGLWYVSQNPENFAYLGNCVLTPNIVELKRIATILGINDVISATQVSAKLGNCWIFSKGITDVITNSTIGIFLIMLKL
ncbi:hypothetical protein MXB_1313 [Myxobolus squamalis]|nr:hypothetical protein MXB_1313 [Myxobolus squamalis]